MKDELLSLLPDYLSLGVVVYDEEGCLKYANNVALRMFGATMKKVYDINIFNDPNIEAKDKATLKKGQNVSFETDYDFDACGKQFFDTCIRGYHKHFVTKVVIMHDEAQVPKGYLLTCEDITEKKAREQEIRNSYKKIQLAQKELSLALNVGKLISWNYQIEDGLFYKFNEQIEQIEKRSIRMILAVIHPDDRQRFLNLLDQLTHKQALTEDNILLRIVEGRDYRYYDFIYNAREDDKGNIAAIIFIQRDVTEDIQYQQNLISAKNKAEEADKLKSTFLANMSH